MSIAYVERMVCIALAKWGVVTHEPAKSTGLRRCMLRLIKKWTYGASNPNNWPGPQENGRLGILASASAASS